MRTKEGQDSTDVEQHARPIGQHVHAILDVGHMIRQVGERVAAHNIRGYERHVVATKEEAECRQQTTGRNERNHVGHAGHEGLLDALAPTNARAVVARRRTAAATRGLNTLRVRILGCRNSLVNHLFSFATVHGALNTGLDDGHTHETIASRNADISSDNDGARSGDVLRLEGLNAAGPLGLDNQLNFLRLRSRFKGLGGHVGVSNTGGAGGDGKQHGLVGSHGCCSRSRGCRGQRLASAQ